LQAQQQAPPREQEELKWQEAEREKEEERTEVSTIQSTSLQGKLESLNLRTNPLPKGKPATFLVFGFEGEKI
jgi:hypothetical protein